MSVELARTVLSKKTSMLFDTYGTGRDYNGVVEFTSKCDALFEAFGIAAPPAPSFPAAPPAPTSTRCFCFFDRRRNLFPSFESRCGEG